MIGDDETYCCEPGAVIAVSVLAVVVLVALVIACVLIVRWLRRSEM